MTLHVLSWMTFLPVLGAIVVATFRRDNTGAVRATGAVTSLATFALSIPLVLGFEPRAGYQFVEEASWIAVAGRFDVHYKIGVDGLSLFMVVLTSFLTPIVLASSFLEISKRVKEYTIAVLLLQSGMTGVFVSLDLFLFYVFWEAMLLPMVLLIGVWGGDRRRYAAVKFFLYTMAGSLLMLFAILVVYYKGGRTFSIEALARSLPVTLAGEPKLATLLFACFTIGFAIKVPLFPFHTWLPDAHVEAPTGASVFLAGVLLKMGTYGLVRFSIPFFPSAAVTYQPVLLVLGLVGIVYGALLALAQTDLKRLVAYSSISHLGFVVVGIFSFETLGLVGAVFQMIAHGLSTGALFLLVGILYQRHHNRDIRAYGGLYAATPRYAGFFFLILLASIGLPGLVGFVGEFLILNGAFRAHWVYAAVGVLGVVLGAYYMLRAFRKIMFGPEGDRVPGTADLRPAEALYLAPLAAAVVLLGVFPRPVLSRIEPSMEALLENSVTSQAVDSR